MGGYGDPPYSVWKDIVELLLQEKGKNCYSGSEIGAPICEERYVASANSIPSLPMRPWVVGSVAYGQRVAKHGKGNTDFQLTRRLLGISM